MITLYALAAAFGIGVLWLGTNIKVVKQFERGVVFRFGRVQSGLRGPGLTMLIPIADRLEKVNMQIITMAVPSQDGITRDNVTVRVDAVIYFRVGSGACGCRRAGLRVGYWPGCTDLTAFDHRQEQSGRPAVQPRASQSGAGVDDRQSRAGLGCSDRPRRNQGCRAARLDEAIDCTPSRGGA